MDDTTVFLYRDYREYTNKRFKAQQGPVVGKDQTTTTTMPTLPTRTSERQKHKKVDSYQITQRLLCTATPPPSLISQSLPRISLRGGIAKQQQQQRHSNGKSKQHKSSTEDLGLLATSPVKHRTTQSLPLLLNHHPSNVKNHKKGPRRDTFDLFKPSRLGPRHKCQSFAWDFRPRSDEDDAKKNAGRDCSMKNTDGNVQGSRPVHLYMSIEMMDKLLQKRKGLRSDATLNEVIGMSSRETNACEETPRNMEGTRKKSDGAKKGSHRPGKHENSAGGGITSKEKTVMNNHHDNQMDNTSNDGEQGQLKEKIECDIQSDNDKGNEAHKEELWDEGIGCDAEDDQENSINENDTGSKADNEEVDHHSNEGNTELNDEDDDEELAEDEMGSEDEEDEDHNSDDNSELQDDEDEELAEDKMGIDEEEDNNQIDSEIEDDDEEDINNTEMGSDDENDDGMEFQDEEEAELGVLQEDGVGSDLFNKGDEGSDEQDEDATEDNTSTSNEDEAEDSDEQYDSDAMPTVS